MPLPYHLVRNIRPGVSPRTPPRSDPLVPVNPAVGVPAWWRRRSSLPDSHRRRWRVRQTGRRPVRDRSASMSQLYREPACRWARADSIPIANDLAEWNILRAAQGDTESRCTNRRMLPTDLEGTHVQNRLLLSQDEFYEYERKRAIETAE